MRLPKRSRRPAMPECGVPGRGSSGKGGDLPGCRDFPPRPDPQESRIPSLPFDTKGNATPREPQSAPTISRQTPQKLVAFSLSCCLSPRPHPMPKPQSVPTTGCSSPATIRTATVFVSTSTSRSDQATWWWTPATANTATNGNTAATDAITFTFTRPGRKTPVGG